MKTGYNQEFEQDGDLAGHGYKTSNELWLREFKKHRLSKSDVFWVSLFVSTILLAVILIMR